MRWVIIYKDFISGGNETLIVRTLHYLNGVGENTKLIVNTVSDSMGDTFDRESIVPTIITEWNIDNVVFEIEKDNDDGLVIVYRLTTYYLLKTELKRCKVIMYCVHPDHLTFDYDKNLIKRLIKRSLFRKTIKKGISSRKVLLMDNELKRIVSDSYRINIKNENVVLLPFERPQEYKDWIEGNKRRILSITRCDFPFKGYILGLIEAVKKLHDKYGDLSLTIISYGKDIDLVNKQIKGFSFIRLIGETNEKELINYYLSSDIYVGMGTTAIDACRYGIPAIIACANTTEFYSAGLLHENPEESGTFNKTNRGIKDLDYLLGLGDDEIREISHKCTEIVNDCYSTRKYIETLRDCFRAGSVINNNKNVFYRIMKKKLCYFE